MSNTVTVLTAADVVASYKGRSIHKNKANSLVSAGMARALESGDIAGAQEWLAAKNEMDALSVNNGSAVAVKSASDWAHEVAQRIAALRDVADQLESGELTPTDLPADLHDDYVVALQSADVPDPDEGTVAAFSGVATRAVFRTTGTKGKLDDHLAELVSDGKVIPGRTYKVSEIAKLASSVYPVPSKMSGRIVARWDRESDSTTLEGWTFTKNGNDPVSMTYEV